MRNRVIAAALLSAMAAAPAPARQSYPPAQGSAPMSPAGAMRGSGSGPMGGAIGMLRRADANGDGVVARDEYVAAIDARFDRMDANRDGVLSPDEMPTRGGGRPGGGGGDTPPPSPANGSSAGATGTPSAPSAPRPAVTRDQYRAGAMRRFDRLDTNHDGRIDGAEMAAATSMRPARGGGMGEAPPPSADR
ncbi:hypothetical protein [Sphingomonas bacterium]|uniref:hypothetical protein n=1 Tax=Sphingomonas bacterium TaxID=1895847 RepID=UPI00157532C9|nr:hypothetical protein [Sphingomonas bacterium]